MLKQFKQIQAVFAAKKLGKFGDFAILKSDLFGAKVAPGVAEKLQSVEGYYPPIDLDKLRQYPLGTFGREYADYMQINHLKPLNVSPELADVAQRNVFALRYAVTHDIFHVLLGFDTTYAGEIGVLAFAAEQNYSKSLKISLRLAQFIYPILAPQQSKMIYANLNKGQKLGKIADFLLGYHFEEHWQEPIEELRKSLKLV
ncbi:MULTISPECIES: Coq4 family protein [unclassified Anabaena]|uniref:Coq4 family protein n=1 Tax=unclassified Anabaena TaxID=2619674 RepID=UPI002B1F358F|nr:Coq4 family protein [Anabaena sp. UHCC 0399]MEA5566532.1 Coq4 family protein [Anabaena sp. UHCC 0399]